MNKNDLRFKKTEMAIKEAYMTLKENSTKPVKVTELCEKAMINKTTFYAHYETIEALKKQICQECTSKLIGSCSHINEFLTNTKAFVNDIYVLFNENEKIILRLYENDINALVNDVEKELLKIISVSNVSEDTEVAIRFCVGGALRLLILNPNEPHLSKTIALIERFIESL